MKRIEVNVDRVIPASPEEVFDAWLDPKTPGGPWSICERVILNPVVDGLFYHAVNHEGRTWSHYGRFLRLDRGRLIQHTWMSEATLGIESTVTVTLEPKGKDTQLTLRHSDLPDDPLGRQHKDGWTFITAALADRFALRGRGA
jgi:uncharacterized protein YndB with AHSA1/START domain